MTTLTLRAIAELEAHPGNTDREALEMWRAQRMDEVENAYDYLPDGLRERIARDTPKALAERMRREL